MSWKITIEAPQTVIEAALVAHEDAYDWNDELVLSGSELAEGLAEDWPHDWRLEVFSPRAPSPANISAIAALFAGGAPAMAIEELAEADWLAQSQLGLEPIRAGAFRVHTPDHPSAPEAGVREFCIPAAQAFGTGHHETTAGCLAMLTRMKAEGVIVRNCADIGTGTGLLAFAALALWPRALATASDIDQACAGVVINNALANGVKLGAQPGAVTMVVAAGMDDPLLQARAPYDLVIANILAGPLIELAADFAATLVPGGHLLLAGLLERQEPAVRAAARRAGLRLARRRVDNGWSILWLRKRARVVSRPSRAGSLPEWTRQW
jgi:ribosomal protein L11 methyltransferase